MAHVAKLFILKIIYVHWKYKKEKENSNCNRDLILVQTFKLVRNSMIMNDNFTLPWSIFLVKFSTKKKTKFFGDFLSEDFWQKLWDKIKFAIKKFLKKRICRLEWRETVGPATHVWEVWEARTLHNGSFDLRVLYLSQLTSTRPLT